MLFYTMHLMRERERSRAQNGLVRSRTSAGQVPDAETADHRTMLYRCASVSGAVPPPGQPVRIQVLKERVVVTYLPVPHEKPVLAALPL